MLPPLIIPNTSPEDLKQPLILVPFEDVLSEIEAMFDWLPPDSEEGDCTEEVWETVMTDLSDRIRTAVETGNGASDWPDRVRNGLSLPRSACLPLRRRLNQVQRAIAAVPDHCTSAFPPAYFALLPQHPAERFDHLVGRGDLPLAWVQTLDVARF